MGYLINPTAMRVGWFQSWNNSFYIDHLYYPQLLHIVLKLRVYLLYLLNQPKWRGKKWLYNNLIITYDYWGLKAHIYYYDGKLEDGWNSYMQEVAVYKGILRKYIDKQQSLKNYRVHLNSLEDYFIILSILLLYAPLRRGYKLKLDKLMSSQLFKSLPLNKTVYSNLYNYKNDWIVKTRVDLYYNLLLNVMQIQLKTGNTTPYNYKFRGSNILDIARWYYIVYDTFMGSKPLLTTLANWISIIFTHMYNINLKVYVSFYLVSNEHITANFLAIYIAQRLKQKYRLSFLINPLLYELKRIRKISWKQSKNKYTSKSLNTQLKYNYNLYTQSLRYLFNSYHTHQYNWFNITNTWINYDSLVSQFTVVNYCLNNYNTHHNFLNNYLSPSNINTRARIFGICRVSNSKKPQILFFVKATYYKLYTAYLLKINKNRSNHFGLKNSPDYFIFVKEMYYDLNNNFFNVSQPDNFDFIFTNVSKLPVWYSLRIGLKSLAKLQLFNYFVQKKTYIYHKYQISKGAIRRFKVRKQHPDRGLIGYKIQLRGRFTRKQIAAKHVFKGGHVPLNTLNSNIDYGFATVPIKNSAIGVKVWLYRGHYDVTNSYMIKLV